MLSFDEQKSLNLVKAHLSIFSLVVSAFAVLFKKSLPTQKS